MLIAGHRRGVMNFEKNHIQFPLDKVNSNAITIPPQLWNVRTLTTCSGQDDLHAGGILFKLAWSA